MRCNIGGVEDRTDDVSGSGDYSGDGGSGYDSGSDDEEEYEEVDGENSLTFNNNGNIDGHSDSS